MKRVFASLAFAAGLGAATASAAIVNVVYTGTVNGGYDQTGVFGIPAVDLTGVAFRAAFVFDTTLGFTYSSAEQNYAYGGRGFGNASPALSATITINGVTAAIDAGSFGYIYGFSASGSSTLLHQVSDYSSTSSVNHSDNLYLSINRLDGGLPADLGGPYVHAVATDDQTYGSFEIISYNFDAGAYTNYAYGSLAPTTVAINAVASAVPEPATWAMMLIGFAGLAMAGRRKAHAAA